MSARNRLPPWHEQVRLANGREVLIRPIRADDAEPLRASFALLQPEEVRQRFLRPVKELSAETVQRLTQPQRSEEHTSELQSLMRISYAVFCLKKKKTNTNNINTYEDNLK